MGSEQKRCCICGEPFVPHPHTLEIQRVCFKDSCRRARVRQNFQCWVRSNPNYQKGRQAKVRAWAKAYPNYWQNYRDDNADYVKRDNKRRVIAMRRARRSAKQITIKQVAVRKLTEIQNLAGDECSAKQITYDRRVDGIMDYLFWTVGEACSAKQINVAIVGVPG